MLKQKMKHLYYATGAAFTVGMFTSNAAMAQNNFSNIAENMQISSSEIPGLLTALAYLFGILLGCLGIMKIKDHVENPANTPLKDGAIRLAAGGALFALPIMYESMLNTVGQTTAEVTSAQVKKAAFNVS